MKKIFGCLISKSAEEEIKKVFEGDLDNITKDKFEELKSKLRRDSNVIIEEGWETAIFIKDDLEEICRLTDDYYNSKCFYKIEELGIYLSEDDKFDGLFVAGDIGNTSEFIEFFLGDDEEEFAKNLEDIVWFDEDNELYEAVQNKLSSLEDDEEVKDDDKEEIELYVSNKFSCDVKEALEDSEEYSDVEYEEVGYFSGEKIYRINEKLYYLTDDSYRFNAEHYFKLREVSKKRYYHFDYK